MPARRPYASRGVPRRATTRPAGTRFSARGALTLLATVVLVFVGVRFAMSSYAASALSVVVPPGEGVLESHASAPAPGTVDAPAAAPSPASNTAPQPAEAEAGPVVADLRPLATPPITSRRWDTSEPGIITDPVLASQLDQALLGVDGHVGVAVKDLGSGRGAVLDGDLELQSASLYKLPVLYTVFDQGLSMNDDLLITQDAFSYDAGTMELGPGETLTVAEALERMITLSDNTSAVMLGGRVGAGRINATLAALGMETTHYSLERMTTSALDMLHLLELAADGKAVSPSASADMVHLMLRQRVNDRLPRLLPDYVQIAHKTGNLPGTVNDVGILYSPTSTVAVAALVSDTTDETAAATAIARIGLIANTYFDERPEVIDRPLIPPAPARAIPPVWREPRPVPPTPTPTEETPSAPVEPEVSAPATAEPATARAAALPPTVAPTAAPTPPPTVAPPPSTATPLPPPPATATAVPPPPTAMPIPPPTKPPARTVASTATGVPTKRN